MGKRKFKQKKIGDTHEYSSFFSTIGIKKMFSVKNIVKFFVVVFCVLLVVYLGKRLLIGAHMMMGHFTKDTVDTLSRKLGEEMKTDEMGNVNILLIGHGGMDHAGGLLADSIIIASWNPKVGSVTMLSVPRDLYINDSEYKIRGKLNSVFASAFYRKRDLSAMVTSGVVLDELTDDEVRNLKLKYASQIMAEELSDVTGLEIPYYAIVDFTEFESLIDTLGGVDIDVPKKLYDSSYPEGKNYVLFTVPKGLNHFDGATALKYARSRHSTSDFDRSARQQQIVKAVKDKLMSKENLTSISKIKSLYEDYSKMVFTNISSSEIIGIIKYASKIEHMFSFVLTSECSYIGYNLTGPGCFLYVPQREAFGGSSVLLPNGATPSNVSYYDYINHFVFFVAHNQNYLIENPSIVVHNGIDKAFARSVGKQAGGHANQIAVKLKKYAFNVVDIDNAESTLTGTSLYLHTGGVYPETTAMLKQFLNIEHIETNKNLGTGVDMLLILGNSYLEDMGNTRFNYEK